MNVIFGLRLYLLRAVLRAVVAVMHFCFELVFWAVAITIGTADVGIDVWLARRRMRAGALTCPNGHEIPTEGELYECSACSYTYQGSIWVCGNFECLATTPFVNCPECSLSVRSPYRFGRRP